MVHTQPLVAVVAHFPIHHVSWRENCFELLKGKKVEGLSRSNTFGDHSSFSVLLPDEPRKSVKNTYYVWESLFFKPLGDGGGLILQFPPSIVGEGVSSVDFQTIFMPLRPIVGYVAASRWWEMMMDEFKFLR